eukprot:GHVU01197205.1.p1 GENE.GHVU01197205.1~~GHVU01197205.1.p1  ORF type:complete len:169 (+),score=16.75 GHVU01197205.1:85-591(+)
MVVVEAYTCLFVNIGDARVNDIEDAWVDAWVHVWVDAWVHAWVGAWADAWVHAWVDAWVDAWMAERVSRRRCDVSLARLDAATLTVTRLSAAHPPHSMVAEHLAAEGCQCGLPASRQWSSVAAEPAGQPASGPACQRAPASASGRGCPRLPLGTRQPASGSVCERLSE